MKYWVAALLLFFYTNSMPAQIGTATLRGTVTDATGAVLQKAEVVLQNEATGLRITTESADDGTFVFTAIQPTIYALTAEAK